MGRLNGADDVYLTSKSIAVRKIKSDRAGRVCEDKTVYIPRTAKNVRKAESIYGKLPFGKK